ncbi:hypothetical protein [Flavobacterium sp. H122]|uniref:hypothetical protein n=1 Tax=Flavobacterium sp. H122 TaxID=2529860 RepID=UPI0010AB40F0|nr:hypothetical protein [Flavobacterium sp. H122]
MKKNIILKFLFFEKLKKHTSLLLLLAAVILNCNNLNAQKTKYSSDASPPLFSPDVNTKQAGENRMHTNKKEEESNTKKKKRATKKKLLQTNCIPLKPVIVR